MPMRTLPTLALTFLTGSSNLLPAPMEQARKIVIAHRGASGYLPEHTLAAKAMTHAMGADCSKIFIDHPDRVVAFVHDRCRTKSQ